MGFSPKVVNPLLEMLDMITKAVVPPTTRIPHLADEGMNCGQYIPWNSAVSMS